MKSFTDAEIAELKDELQLFLQSVDGYVDSGAETMIIDNVAQRIMDRIDRVYPTQSFQDFKLRGLIHTVILGVNPDQSKGPLACILQSRADPDTLDIPPVLQFSQPTPDQIQ